MEMSRNKTQIISPKKKEWMPFNEREFKAKLR